LLNAVNLIQFIINIRANKKHLPLPEGASALELTYFACALATAVAYLLKIDRKKHLPLPEGAFALELTYFACAMATAVAYLLKIDRKNTFRCQKVLLLLS